MSNIPEKVKNQLLEDLLSCYLIPPPTTPRFSPYKRADKDLLIREQASQSFALLIELLTDDPEIKLKLNHKRCDLRAFPLADGEFGLYSFLLKLQEKNIKSFKECKKELKATINDLSEVSAKPYQFFFALNFQSLFYWM